MPQQLARWRVWISLMEQLEPGPLAMLSQSPVFYPHHSGGWVTYPTLEHKV